MNSLGSELIEKGRNGRNHPFPLRQKKDADGTGLGHSKSYGKVAAATFIDGSRAP